MSRADVIEPGERGFLRLFAVDLPEPELRALAAEGPALDDTAGPARPFLPAAPALLGHDGLNLDRAELFPLGDLSGLGLESYLIQAYDIAAAELAPHRAALENLKGFVLILPSEATPDGATLAPHPALHFAARLETPKAAISMQRLNSEAGRGFAGPAGGTDRAEKPAAPARLLAFAAIVILAMAVWLWLTL